MPSPSPISPKISPTPASLSPAATHNLRRIGLLPFVAVLFAYCTGGPFGFESMVSTSGPGLALTFLLVVPLLFAVPISLASAEMTTAMPVEGGFYRWSRAALGDFWGFQSGWLNWTGTFLMSASYGVAMADYFNAWIPLRSHCSTGLWRFCSWGWLHLLTFSGFDSLDSSRCCCWWCRSSQ